MKQWQRIERMQAKQAGHVFKVPAYSCCQASQTEVVIVEQNGVCTGYCPTCFEYVKNYNPAILARPKPVAAVVEKDFFYIVGVNRVEGCGVVTEILAASDDPIPLDAYRAAYPGATVRIEPALIGQSAAEARP